MKRTVTISESHWMSVDCSDGEKTSQRGELWRSCVEVCIETESLLTLATIRILSDPSSRCFSFTQRVARTCCDGGLSTTFTTELVQETPSVLLCVMFSPYCPRCDLVSVVDPCYHQHRVHFRWPLTFLNAVLSLGGWQLTCTFQYLWTKNMHRCLRDKKNRKLKVLAEIVLWESPPGANVLPTPRHHPAA